MSSIDSVPVSMKNTEDRQREKQTGCMMYLRGIMTVMGKGQNLEPARDLLSYLFELSQFTYLLG